MRTIFAEYNPKRNSIDVYTSVSYNISGKFIIGLYKRKETAALKIKVAVLNCLVFLLPSCGR